MKDRSAADAARERTLTRADLTHAVQRLEIVSRTSSLGEPQSRDDAAQLLEIILDEIASALEAGDVVKISAFGSFTARQKAQRIGRNPRTGVEAVITPRRSLSFKASNVLRNSMNAAPTGPGASPEQSL